MIAAIVINALLLAVILGVGVFLHRMGQPYSPLWYNLHKLIALGLVVYAAFVVISFARTHGFTGLFAILVILTVVSAIALFVSGGLMGANKMQEAMMRVHRVANFAFIAGLAGVFYSLWDK